MSYILDALRKSEQQRQRGVAPLLFTTQMSSNAEQQPAFLLYGLVAAILICAGILIGWLRPWQQDAAGTATDSIALTQYEAKPPQAAPISQPLSPEPEKARKAKLVLPVQKSISTVKLAARASSVEQDVSTPFKVIAQPRKSQTSTALPNVPEPMMAEAALPAMEKAISSESHGTNGPTETAPEQKIISMTELPLAIQQEIPMMSISAHVYSSIPKERFVGINERLLQEGEYLESGLRLEQIGADGLVFSYKKYLFRHSL